MLSKKARSARRSIQKPASITQLADAADTETWTLLPRRKQVYCAQLRIYSEVATLLDLCTLAVAAEKSLLSSLRFTRVVEEDPSLSPTDRRSSPWPSSLAQLKGI